MKLQRVKINNRYDYDINFESQDIREENFIIQLDAAREGIPLIAFKESDDGHVLVETDSDSDDCRAQTGSITFRKNDDEQVGNQLDCVDIVLNFSMIASGERKDIREVGAEHSDGKPVAGINKNMRAYWDNEDDEYKLLMDVNPAYHNAFRINLQINLSYENAFGPITASRTVIVNVAPANMIADAILDFGSEASQLVVVPRDAAAITIEHFSELFTNLRTKHEGEVTDKKSLADSDFFQYDSSSNQLFRSRFFLHDHVTEEQIEEVKRHGMRQTPHLMRILTTEREVQDQEFRKNYVPAPNVKLSSYGGIMMKKLTIGNMQLSPKEVGGSCYLYYRMGISIFLTQILDQVSHDLQRHFVSIHLLMPNVYLQKEINEILDYLQEDIFSLLSSSEYQHIYGFELTAVSESDASVMGVCEYLMGKGEFPGEGNYLLLDAGKGTLDFSLVSYKRTENGTQFQNVWRSGIVGAGSSLSYGYFLALIHEFLTIWYNRNEITEEDIKQFIFRNVLGEGPGKKVPGAGDTAYIFKMMRAVDKYKMYHTIGSRPKEVISKKPLESLKLEDFVGWLENGINEDEKSACLIADEGYINQMIDALITDTMNKIRMMHVGADGENVINYVIFAGRAFGLDRFRSRMLKEIEMVYPSVRALDFVTATSDAVTLKNVCLLCINPLLMGNYNRKITSKPVLIQRFNRQAAETSRADRKVKSKKDSSFLDSLANIFGFGRKARKEEAPVNENREQQSEVPNGGESEGSFIQRIFGDTENYEFTQNEDMHYYIHDSGTAAFNLGGVIYALNGYANGDASLFFIDGRYHIRMREKLKPLRMMVNLATSDFVQSSFFPLFTPADVNDVVLIPKVHRYNCSRVERTVSVSSHEKGDGAHVYEEPVVSSDPKKKSGDNDYCEQLAQFLNSDDKK